MPIAAEKPVDSTNGTKSAKEQILYQSQSKFFPLSFDDQGRYFLKPDPNLAVPKGIQEYYRLRQECLRKGILFEDRDFAADYSSLPNPPNEHDKETEVEWLRPQEIDPDAIFANEGFSRFAVQQGALGDCWLLAAAANLTLFPELFHRVVPEDNDAIRGGRKGVDYAGIFHFRFWRFGQWYDVVIDDRLPTQNGHLMYIQSTRNEFWSALLEKAYAKLFGTYEALDGGNTHDALEDFTGGVTESYDVKETSVDLFEVIEQGCKQYAMFGCGLKGDPKSREGKGPKGLITGHAYSITKAQEVNIKTPRFQGKVKLLRLRNPWGNDKEWNGGWSDQSPEWKFIDDATKRSLGLTFDNDGEFWMSYDDFKTYYDHLEVCNLAPDCPIVQQNPDCPKWKTSAFDGEWVKGSTAGGCRDFMDTFCRNPQYKIEIPKPEEGGDQSTLIVALTQKNRRSRQNKGISCLPIGFCVYRVDPRELRQKPLESTFFRTRPQVGNVVFSRVRENSCRFKVDPGTYVVVPSTYHRNEEAEFILRVFSETSNNMVENDSAVDVSEPEDINYGETEQQVASYEHIFNDVAGDDGEIDWMELKMLLDTFFKDDMAKAAEGIRQAYQPDAQNKGPAKQEIMLQKAYLSNSGFSKDACRSMVAMLDEDGSGKLGLPEFQKLLTNIFTWKAVFKKYDSDNNGHLSPFELRSALESAGFTLNNRIINKLMHRYSSKDGQIWFDDFITCAVKIRTMFDTFRALDKQNQNEISFGLDEWISQTIYS